MLNESILANWRYLKTQSRRRNVATDQLSDASPVEGGFRVNHAVYKQFVERWFPSFWILRL